MLLCQVTKVSAVLSLVDVRKLKLKQSLIDSEISVAVWRGGRWGWVGQLNGLSGKSISGVDKGDSNKKCMTPELCWRRWQ